MQSVLTPPETGGGSSPPFSNVPNGGGDGPNPGGNPHDRSLALLGTAIVMVASCATFTALISTMLLRRSLGGWVRTPVPKLFWWNTAVLLISSTCLELARSSVRRGNRQRFNLYWGSATALGGVFLAGQAAAWLLLYKRGIFLATNPSSSFLYILSWAHAAHAVVAWAVLFYVWWRAVNYQLGPQRRGTVAAAALFWHFLDVLWIALMATLVLWG